MTAPDFTPDERRTLARFDAAPDALALREEVAEVLLGHWESGDPRTHKATCGCYWQSGEHFFGDAEGAHGAWSEHVADALADLIEAREKAAAVRALRDAHDDIEAELICCDAFKGRDQSHPHQMCYWVGAAAHLVSDRADRMEGSL